MDRNTLSKSERLNSKKLIDRLFEGGSKSFSVYPLRAVLMPLEAHESPAPASILISVPKRRFKRAVKRNKVKRQIREAYRKNKHHLLDVLQAKQQTLIVAFIYIGDEIIDSCQLEEKVVKLLTLISEKITDRV